MLLTFDNLYHFSVHHTPDSIGCLKAWHFNRINFKFAYFVSGGYGLNEDSRSD